jgi:hypothetical protein
MSYSISTLLTRNLHDVFGENDPARRRAAIDEMWHEELSTIFATSRPLKFCFRIFGMPISLRGCSAAAEPHIISRSSPGSYY